MDESLDILAFAPHPDDAELGCGGSLILAADQGLRVAVADLTDGERASRGTPQARAQEKRRASLSPPTAWPSIPRATCMWARFRGAPMVAVSTRRARRAACASWSGRRRTANDGRRVSDDRRLTTDDVPRSRKR